MRGARESLRSIRPEGGGRTRSTDAFDDIRLIQTYIMSRARKHGVPVIENGNIEAAIGEVRSSC
jgi:2-phosphoglycerate kinase